MSFDSETGSTPPADALDVAVAVHTVREYLLAQIERFHDEYTGYLSQILLLANKRDKSWASLQAARAAMLVIADLDLS